MMEGPAHLDPVNEVLEAPSDKRKVSKKEIQKTRDLCMLLVDLAYKCKDQTTLRKVNQNLADLVGNFRKTLPTEGD